MVLAAVPEWIFLNYFMFIIKKSTITTHNLLNLLVFWNIFTSNKKFTWEKGFLNRY